MSQDATRPIWVDALLSHDITPAEYRMWTYLYWRQGDNGCAWPSQESIAADLGLSTEAVRKITKRLAASGWLTIRWPGPGQGRRKMYTVQHPDRPAETPTGVPVSDGRNPNDGLGLDERNPNGGTGETPTAVPVHIRRTLTRTLPKEKTLSSDAVRLAGLLRDSIIARKPDFKCHNLPSWTLEMDRMIRLDHRDPQAIESIIRWSQQDPFWSSTVLSPASLRKNFDQLELKTKGHNHDRRKSAPLREGYDYGTELIDARTGEKVPAVRR